MENLYLAKSTAINFETTKMNWLLGLRSNLCLEDKLLLHKTIVKPVLSYGDQLWGSVSNTNVNKFKGINRKC